MKRRASVALALAILALLTLGGVANADDAYSPRALKLARELNCPVCSGESVADSQSELARQMRDIIQQKVAAGESDDQIISYFRERYGDGVLAEPPKSGFTLTLWWVPVIALAIGALTLGLFLRERTRRAVAVAELSPPLPPRDDELEAIAREVLGNDSMRAAPQ